MKRALFVLITLLSATALFGDDVIRCDSEDGHRHDCRYNGYGDVTLRRVYSRAACVQGESWGVRGEHIWVDRGCRAEFLVSGRRERGGNEGGGGRRGETITCESNGSREFCSAETRNGIHLERQISRSECIEGRTWGFNDRGIWVDHGCRAEFRVGRGGGSGGGYHRREELVTCESDNNRTHKCYVDTRGGVRISRQLSKTSCVYGRTWGYDNNGIWVRDGCRAEFTVTR